MKVIARNLVAGVFIALYSLLAHAQSLDPNNKRGFEPGKTYNFSGLDSVSTFSGNLNVAIPIGQGYEVRPGFNYQFVLSHNSRVWDFARYIVPAEGGEPGGLDRISIPETYSNAGLGWLLSVGRVIVPGTGLVNRFTYVSPDGAHHEFYSTLRGSGNAVAGIRYTNDGTYMRMTLTPSNVPDSEVTGIKIETRDGLVHFFTATGELDKITDRYGNWLEVVRAPTGLLWTFNEGRGEGASRVVARSHSITFEDKDDDYLHENFKRRVKRVELAAFPQPDTYPVQDRAVYTFHYEDTTLDGSACGTHSEHPVPLLASVELPDGSTFAMSYDRNETCSSGAITNLTLPTKGRINWAYDEYPMARDVCIFADPYYPGDLWHDSYPGVRKRTLFGADDTLLEETDYTRELVDRGEFGSITCDDYRTGSPKPITYENKRCRRRSSRTPWLRNRAPKRSTISPRFAPLARSTTYPTLPGRNMDCP